MLNLAGQTEPRRNVPAHPQKQVLQPHDGVGAGAKGSLASETTAMIVSTLTGLEDLKGIWFFPLYGSQPRPWAAPGPIQTLNLGVSRFSSCQGTDPTPRLFHSGALEEQDGWVLQQSPGEKAGKQPQDLRGLLFVGEVSVCVVSQLHMATHRDRTTSVHPVPGGRMLQPLCPWGSAHSHVCLAVVPVVVQPLRVSPERCRSLPSLSLSQGALSPCALR